MKNVSYSTALRFETWNEKTVTFGILGIGTVEEMEWKKMMYHKLSQPVSTYGVYVTSSLLLGLTKFHTQMKLSSGIFSKK